MSDSGQRDEDQARQDAGDDARPVTGEEATIQAGSGSLSDDPATDRTAAGMGFDKTEISGDGQGTPPASVIVDTTSSRDLTGKTLSDRYAVLEEIGRGGMSVIYLARHELLNKIVAIKVLREEMAGHKDSLKRFHREARAAASIGDPHIVDVTDYGFTKEGDAFIVMEHLEGQDLRALVGAEGALEPGRAVAIARQILKGLCSAHARGIVHRDLKGENVFVTQRDEQDFIKVLDFGISKLVQPLDGDGDATGLTSTGQVLGTPQYLAPEQAHGTGDVDHRADIYAMGIILYEMLTGQLPFTGKSVFEVLMKHAQEAPEPPSKRRPDLKIPAKLEQVVLKALSKKPEDRYSSAEEMLDALPRATDLPGGFSSRTMPPLPKFPRPPKPPPIPVLVATVFVVLAVVVFFVVRSRAPSERTVVKTVTKTTTRGIGGVTGAAGPDANPPELRAQAPDAATTITVEVEASPRRAQIFLGDELLGSGRISKSVPRGDRPVVLRVTARGYQPQTRELIPSANTRIVVQLRRRSRRPGKPDDPGGDIKKSPY